MLKKNDKVLIDVGHESAIVDFNHMVGKVKGIAKTSYGDMYELDVEGITILAFEDEIHLAKSNSENIEGKELNSSPTSD